MCITPKGYIGIDVDKPIEKFDVNGSANIRGNVNVKGALTVERYKPRWDSGWVEDDNKNNHRTSFEHNLNYLPEHITLYFSPTKGGERVYPKPLSRKKGINGNPVTKRKPVIQEFGH